MGDKTIVNDGASVTEFDAENLPTGKEKGKNNKAPDEIRKVKKA